MCKSCIISHKSASMPGMKDPTKRLGEIIGRIQHTRDEVHDNVANLFPIIDSKPLNINMLNGWSRLISIHHEDSSLVIFVDWSWTIRRKPQFSKDGPKVSSYFSSGHSDIEELCLSRTDSSEGLSISAVFSQINLTYFN